MRLYKGHLKEKECIFIKVRLLQELSEDDFDRSAVFCKILTERGNQNPNFSKIILFSDKTTFMLHWKLEIHTKHPQNISVWAGIIDQPIIGPFFIEDNLIAYRYLNLLQTYTVAIVRALYPVENKEVL